MEFEIQYQVSKRQETGISSSKWTNIGTGENVKAVKLPRIIVRDVSGRILDTETSYQRAIAEARYRISIGDCVPPDPEQWRLPNGPLPARPDYTRKCPPLLRPQWRHFQDLRRRELQLSLPDNFKESLRSDEYEDPVIQRLVVEEGEPLPVLANIEWLRRYLRDPKGQGHYDPTFLPFVGMAPTEERSLLETDRREPDLPMPKFCYGCRRTGLCYGCEKGFHPHIHSDRPVRTGGGFTYFKRDVPSSELAGRNPLYWKVGYGPPPMYVFYDDKRRVQENIDEFNSRMSLRTKRIEEGTPILLRSDTRGQSTLDSCEEYTDRDSGKGTTLDEIQNKSLDKDSNSTFRLGPISQGIKVPGVHDDASESGISVTSHHQTSRLPVLSEDRTESESGIDTGRSGKHSGLYKAPKAFTPKKNSRKITSGRTPFSEERDFDFDYGEGIKIKKSDKESTKFVEIERGDDSWNEPKKFETKSRESTSISTGEPKRKKEGKHAPRVSDESEDRSKRIKRDTQPSSPVKSDRQHSKDEVVSYSRSRSNLSRSRSSIKDTSSILKRSKSGNSEDTFVKTSPEGQPKKSSGGGGGSVGKSVEFREPIVDRNKSEDTHNKVRPLSKKERKEGQVKRPKSKKREELPKVPQPVKAKPKTREPSPVEKELSLSPEPDAPAFERDWTLPPPIKSEPQPLPKASPIIPPTIEDYEELNPPKRDTSKTIDDHPPPLLEPVSLRAIGDGTKKKRRRERKKLKPPAFSVAPIAKPDIKGVVDPLDYLSKYCIITPDRLPVYARVFEETIGMQLYPFSNVPPNPEHVRNYDNSTFADEQMPQAKWTRKPVLSEKEKNKIDNYILIDQPTHNASQVKSASDQMVDKINFTNDSLLEKYEKLQGELEKLQREKIKTILQIAKRDYQQITMKDYKPVKDKKKKKKLKNSSPIPILPKNIFEPSPNETALEKSERLNWLNLHANDDEIYSRINQNIYSTICEDEEMKRIDLLLRRTTDKLKQVDDRIEDLEDEKKMLLLNSRDIYDINMTKETKPDEFRRRQSVLYQNVHPAVDYEMNFSELEEALQDVNNHLITKNELKYIYYILDVPGKRRINMQLFSVIAALSEKVAQVDSLVRNLINKFDYEALDIKMEKAKELFYLLDGENNYDVPEGKAGANNLLVELTAGGLTSEHVELVVRKFNRDQTGIIDFLDFLTYIPLFLEIHSRIVNDPLNQERDL